MIDRPPAHFGLDGIGADEKYKRVRRFDALLDLIPPEKGRIVMLEPRRIAAVSAARWMAKSLGEEVGGTVGYTIRFDSRVSERTRIEVVTEGVLTRRIQSDPGLEGVAMVIFDEFHERSLHADLALALCLDLRAVREDLQILVMSATLDCGPIAALLGGAPVIASEGRAFPVEERYIADRRETRLSERIAEAVGLALRETEGDILVFLPGAGEIRTCSEAIRSMAEKRDVTLHPLYGDLPFEEQERAILPSSKRKIVLATNIAETSLTIEGVRVVIDSGLTRRLQYDPSTGMNRLVTVSVSRASAEQRKGRAGRLGPGVCYRLYSSHTFQSFIPFSPPEITTSDLSSLCLDLAVWGVRDPEALSWLDSPPAGAWEAARQLLFDLGALDHVGMVTAMGKAMARLPLHPRLSHLLLRAVELGCPSLGADLAALLSERDIIRRSRPGGMFQSQESDITERLHLLQDWRKGKESSCADLSALRTVERTSGQLLRLVKGRSSAPWGTDGLDIIARLLLSAFPDRIGMKREEDGRFLLSQGRGVRLAPGSGLARERFIVAVHVDAGEKGEGLVHLATPVTEEVIRQDCSRRIRENRRVEWDRRAGRVIATLEERLDALVLSSRPFTPKDEEVIPIICDFLSMSPEMIPFTDEARQCQGRVNLMRRAFPEEQWPDLSDDHLFASVEDWLPSVLKGIRTEQAIAGMNILPALQSLLTWNQMRLLDERAPVSIPVPSGHRIQIDYASGEIPVLAVKLQEMFGLADTPAIAGGRVKLLLHLLSPARRPLQVTQDLKGFWNTGYQEVRREMRGRYPKHPWPDDPWNAIPTRRAKPRP
ncbi:MAG: ATP-dependent helicase HrpB [Nitrospirales bacterium]|nr:ATP-dependent helicase HrpB [Nitrospirales bacterium]